MTDHSTVFSIMTALVLLTIVFVFGMKYFPLRGKRKPWQTIRMHIGNSPSLPRPLSRRAPRHCPR